MKSNQFEDRFGILFTRYDLINYLIYLNDYQSYLEIGVSDGYNFENVNAVKKYGVDPNKNYEKLTHHMTSDQFFENNTETFDIIFIDGLHLSEQVILDIDNSLKVLNKNGTIVMHDCLPFSEDLQYREPAEHNIWSGDVWKAFAHYRQNEDLNMFTINTDYGLGVIQKGNQKTFQLPEILNWNFYVANRNEMMNVHSVSDGLRKLKENKFNNH